MIIDRLNACDVGLTGNVLRLWQCKWLVIGSAKAAAGGQNGRSLGEGQILWFWGKERPP